MENFGFLHVQSVSNDFSGKQINCTQTLPHGVHMCSGLQIKTKEPPRVVKVCVTHNTYLNCSSQPWQPQDSAGHHKQDANSLKTSKHIAFYFNFTLGNNNKKKPQPLLLSSVY